MYKHLYDLRDVSVGDVLIHDHCQVVEVTKVTSKTVETTGNYEFDKYDGHRIGVSEWYMSFARKPKHDSEIKEMKESIFKQNVLCKLKDMRTISLEDAIKVCELFKWKI